MQHIRIFKKEKNLSQHFNHSNFPKNQIFECVVPIFFGDEAQAPMLIKSGVHF